MSTVDDLRTASAEVRKYWGVPIAGPVANLLDFEAGLIERVPGSEMQGRSRLLLSLAHVITKQATDAPERPVGSEETTA
jgi:hypothetical protein